MMSLENTNQMKPWALRPMKCPICKKNATFFTPTATKEQECSDCFQERLQERLSMAKPPERTWEYFAFSLSALGTMEDRLMALTHFKNFQAMEKLPELLVDNLGFESVHPLSNFVRKKALDAVCQFNDTDKMLKALFAIKRYDSWQHKANAAMAAYLLAPTKPRVKSLVIRMASDPSPNVRCHVAKMIIEDTSSWTRDLFQRLSLDTNPLVREACREATNSRDNQAIREKKAPKPQPIKKKSSDYNRVEKIVLRYFDYPEPEKIYELYLGHIPDLLDRKKYDIKEIAALKKNTKESQVRLLAAALSSKELFKSVLEKLPGRVVTLLYLCVGEPSGLDTEMAEQKLLQLMEHDPSFGAGEMPLQTAAEKDPAFFLFKAEESWSRRYYGDESYEIAINQGLMPFVRQMLPQSIAPDLIPVKDVENKVAHIHDESHRIFEQLPVILSFIGQDKLQFGKNNDRILVSSLKKMAEVCNINEFYANGDKELNHLKTELVAQFFSCRSSWQTKELQDLPAFIKTTMESYFEFKELKTHRTRETFDYIKRQLDLCDSDSDEKKMRKDLKEIFKLLIPGEWVSINNLAMVGFYRGLHFNPFSNQDEVEDLYISMDTNRRHHDRDRKNLQWLYPFDTMALPFIKRMMFLFGALGMVDLGYSTPENNIYKQYGKPYLTVFDGLKYVRLTDFGNYVAGRKKSFAADITIPSAEIEIDEHKTMLSIYGDDPVKRMALDAVGEKINKSSYMVNYQSFLKECATQGEVENKIQFFRETIAEKPPAIWELFFNEVLARMNPLESLPAMSVFRVKPDRVLLSLLSTDSILKKYVTKAENHHMIVEKTHFSKVKKRLALFGYFVS